MLDHRLNGGGGREVRRRYQFKATDSFDSAESSESDRKQRFMSKSGFPRVTLDNVRGLQEKAMKDIFHTIVDAKWACFIVLFTIRYTFILSLTGGGSGFRKS